MNKIKKFDEAYNLFLREEDPVKHRKAVLILMKEAGLEDRFVEISNGKDKIKDFFLLWEYAGKVEKNLKDRKGLKQMGELSKKFYDAKDYFHLCDLFYNIVFRHFAEYARLEERDDFDKITDHDLYEKGLIPSEIFLQYFIMETMVKQSDFAWDRGEEIANKNLACFITCWSDLYDFFNEQE